MHVFELLLQNNVTNKIYIHKQMIKLSTTATIQYTFIKFESNGTGIQLNAYVNERIF